MQLYQQKHLSLKRKLPPRKHLVYSDNNVRQKELQTQKVKVKVVKARSEKDTQTIKDHSASTSLVLTTFNQRDVLDYSNGLGYYVYIYIIYNIYIYIYIYNYMHNYIFFSSFSSMNKDIFWYYHTPLSQKNNKRDLCLSIYCFKELEIKE